MQEMIRQYEQSRALLQGRIRSLNARLRHDGALGNMERDTLLLRRNLLMTESAELLSAIEQMQERYAEGTGRRTAC